jgi:hypothetical protein
MSSRRGERPEEVFRSTGESKMGIFSRLFGRTHKSLDKRSPKR